MCPGLCFRPLTRCLVLSEIVALQALSCNDLGHVQALLSNSFYSREDFAIGVRVWGNSLRQPLRHEGVAQPEQPPGSPILTPPTAKHHIPARWMHLRRRMRL